MLLGRHLDGSNVAAVRSRLPRDLSPYKLDAVSHSKHCRNSIYLSYIDQVNFPARTAGLLNAQQQVSLASRSPAQTWSYHAIGIVSNRYCTRILLLSPGPVLEEATCRCFQTREARSPHIHRASKRWVGAACLLCRDNVLNHAICIA